MLYTARISRICWSIHRAITTWTSNVRMLEYPYQSSWKSLME